MYALLALVARPVNQKELNSNPEAQKSLDVELEKLVNKRAWVIASVREWDDVRSEAKHRFAWKREVSFPRTTPYASLKAGPCSKGTMYRTKTPVQHCFQS